MLQRVRSDSRTHPKTEAPLLVWKRVPMGGAAQEWPLVAGTEEQRAHPGEEVWIKSITRRAGDSWIVTFFLILLVGFVYVWRKGVLDWGASPQRVQRDSSSRAA